MSLASGPAAERWQAAAAPLTGTARHVAALFAVDPVGTGGVVIRALATPARDAWLQLLRDLLPEGTPLRRVPLHINDERLLGGLDLAATLQAGRPIAQQGVLTLADGGVVLLAMAERLAAATAARVAAVLDTKEVALEREGLGSRHATRFGVVAFDEGLSDDERMASALLDRMAFALDLHPVLDDGAVSSNEERLRELPMRTAADVVAARALLPHIEADVECVQALVAAALQLGVDSIRAPLLAVRVARAAAALDGRLCLIDEDVALAASLVLAPRATRMPLAAPPDDEPQPDVEEPADAPPEEAQSPDDADTTPPDPTEDAADESPDETERQPTADDLAELVLEAAQAAIPPGLLAALQLGLEQRARSQASGRVGAAKASQSRGRPRGARRGEPRAGARLNVIETLRAAAPWQKLRQADLARAALAAPVAAGQRAAPSAPVARVQVRREDFHITRYQQRSATTTVFVVDASGSSALNRLAEAKGAVELLLADCYVRRDQVAVLSFRGRSAELLLPPTRSLVRAKRSLAGLPGGGGTPLASGIDAAAALGQSIARRGETPIVVLLTDGRGNVSRDGSPGRAKAAEDVDLAARQYRMAGLSTLLIDTSPQPQAAAQELARTLGAAYLPLPYAGSAALSRAVAQAGQAVSAASTPR
ncbi:MAG: magnesium chelatase ATPase subunit D [Burkholderiales bacterium 28-67-8]|nr:MAG: magnesium chelatase ATPase subunit D [Burkholderiales bacterium 28-67-8]